MDSFNDVLGHMLARVDEANVKKVISGYDPDKPKPLNVNLLASSRFLLKDNIDPAITFLVEYTAEFFPHASPILENTASKPKLEKAADIINVFYAISPMQCRKCTKTYISTSANNTENTLNCLLCGRKSHANCYKDYTVDNAVGIVFLCDPCLTTSETAIVLETIKHKPEPKETETPNGEDAASEYHESNEPPTDEMICPLYKENSCPHGLTGKRHIDGQPCPYSHPRKCFYHIGKYGESGCRYSAKRCPFYHPVLCENSLKLQMCLNKQCKHYHKPGTKRSYREPRPQPDTEHQSGAGRHSRGDFTPRTTTPMWESQRNHEDNRPRTTIPRWEAQPTDPTHQQTHENVGKDSFLAYIQQMNSNMQNMKIEMEKSVRDIIRETISQKPAVEQHPQQKSNIPAMYQIPQNIPNPNESAMIPNHSQSQNLQQYHQMPVTVYPVMRPNM